jgi:hypothetical protein
LRFFNQVKQLQALILIFLIFQKLEKSGMLQTTTLKRNLVPEI